MNQEMHHRALQDAGIPLNEVHPQIVVSVRVKDATGSWAVFVVGANAWAFELPLQIEQRKVLEVAQAVTDWDMATAERAQLSPELVNLIVWAAMLMNPCPLKTVIDSAHPLAASPSRIG